MISLRELLDKALLSIPKTDATLTLEDLQHGARFKNIGGVYTFYNVYDEPLYVGISNKIDKRVHEHLGSDKGNKDLLHYLKTDNEIYVTVFYEPSKLYQEIYESYLIFVLNPRYNIAKTGREKI